MVWGFRRYFAPYVVPAIGLLLLALLQADLAATAARASGVLISRFAAQSPATAAADAALPRGNAASAASAGPGPGPAGGQPRGVLPAEFVLGTVADTASVGQLALLMGAFLLLALGLRVWTEQVRGLVNEGFRQRLQRDIVAAMARELGETRAIRSGGNATQIFLADAAGLSAILIFGLVAAAESLLMIAVYAMRLWRLPNGWLVVVGLFPLVVIFQAVVARAFLRRAAEATERSEGLRVQLRARAAEFFDVLGRLAYFKGERSEGEKLLGLSYRSGQAGRRYQFVSSVASGVAEMGTTLSFPLVVIVLSVPFVIAALARYDVSMGVVTAGSLMEMQGLLLLLTASTGSIIELPGLLAQFSPTLRRIKEILDIPEPGPQPPELDALRLNRDAPHLVVAGLSFTYPGAAGAVLRDITFEIPSGARVGIVGASGCGKSTLGRLLLGDQRPTSGRIILDGVDVTEWHLWWRRELVGFLPAEQGFLRGTLEENILFGRPRGSVRDLDRALRASGVAGIVEERMADGGLQFRIDGRVEDVLSTGQRRKVGIARLLVGEHRVWILDEPGSGLDPRSMREVAEGLAQVTTGRTCLIITHDPDVFVTDFNVFLQDGTIADVGPHAELLQRNRAYAGLVSRFLQEREEEQQQAGAQKPRPADVRAPPPLVHDGRPKVKISQEPGAERSA
jgi:ATP-binding cassette subfamily B protein